MPVVLGAYAVGVATNNRSLRDGIFGCAASYAAQSIARNYVLYPLVARTRPDTARRGQSVPPPPPASQGDQYRFDVPGSPRWGECAAFLNNRFNMGFAEPVLYAVAGGVGVGRLLDRGHWASDQVLGIIFGYAIGREVAKRSLDRLSRDASRANGADGGEDAPAASSLQLGPVPGGMRIGWVYVF
jgi:hypothetical protein